MIAYGIKSPLSVSGCSVTALAILWVQLFAGFPLGYEIGKHNGKMALQIYEEEGVSHVQAIILQTAKGLDLRMSYTPWFWLACFATAIPAGLFAFERFRQRQQMVWNAGSSSPSFSLTQQRPHSLRNDLSRPYIGAFMLFGGLVAAVWLSYYREYLLARIGVIDLHQFNAFMRAAPTGMAVALGIAILGAAIVFVATSQEDSMLHKLLLRSGSLFWRRLFKSDLGGRMVVVGLVGAVYAFCFVAGPDRSYALGSLVLGAVLEGAARVRRK